MYELHKFNNYNLYLMKSDNFKTISLSIRLRKEKTREDSVYLSILKDILNSGTNNYKNIKDYNKAKLEIYDPSIDLKIVNFGKDRAFVIDSKFAHEKYTEKGMNKKTIEFIFDILYNPKIKNKTFDKETFSIAKHNYIETLKSAKDDPFKYTSDRLWEEMDIYDFKILTNKEAIKVASNITEKTLYEYYENLFKTNSLDIFVVGNINFKEIKNIISSIVKGEFQKSQKDHYITYLKPKKEIKEVIETIKSNQSQLGIGLKFIGLTDFERKYVSVFYTMILGGGWSSKLMQKIREENSLCYFIGTNRSISHSLAFIYASIDAKNYKEVLEKIKKEVESMKKGDFEENHIDRVKQIYLNSLLEIEDNQISLMNNLINTVLSNNDTIEKRKENIIKVTKEDIVNISNKVYFDVVYLLRGDIDG